jgi:hypothetical protein
MARMTIITGRDGKLLGAVSTTARAEDGSTLHFAKHPSAEQNYHEVEVPDDLSRRPFDEVQKTLEAMIPRNR